MEGYGVDIVLIAISHVPPPPPIFIALIRSHMP